MSDVATEVEEPQPPVAGVTMVYLGPVAPHWEIRFVFGDQAAVDAFRSRAMARLVLLPPHDPQFRRNRERVTRDAERENFQIAWDLGLPDDDAPPVAPTADGAGAGAEAAPTEATAATADAAPAEPAADAVAEADTGEAATPAAEADTGEAAAPDAPATTSAD